MQESNAENIVETLREREDMGKTLKVAEISLNLIQVWNEMPRTMIYMNLISNFA